MGERFKIIWHDGSYRVSIPSYEGGDVVDAASFDIMVKALRAAERIVADRAAGGRMLTNKEDAQAALVLCREALADVSTVQVTERNDG